MGVESAADRLVFLSADDFGTSVSYQPQAGGDAVTFLGIFDAAHQMVDGQEMSVTSVAPVLTLRTDDLVTLPFGDWQRGDRVSIGAALYVVTDGHPDGTGMTQLVLEKHSA